VTPAVSRATSPPVPTATIRETASLTSDVPEPAPKKWRLKDGKTEEEVDEAELVRRAHLGTHAHRRIKGAAELEKRFNDLDSKLKTPAGLIELAEKMGYQEDDLRQVLEDYYDRRFIKPKEMSPEQRRIAELEAAAKKRAEEDRAREEDTKKTHFEQLKAHHKAKLSEFVRAALTEGKLPADEDHVRLVAHEIHLLRKAGLPVDVKSVAAEVRRRVQQTNERRYTTASDEELESMFTPEVLKRFLKLSVSLHKKRLSVPAPAPLDPNAEPAPEKKSSQKYIGMNAWLKKRR
jgi:hypothetical protein